MYTIRLLTDIGTDRHINLVLPPDAPTGKSEVELKITPQTERKKLPRTSLTEWAKEFSEDWGDRLNSTDVEGFTGRRY
jgi:hypothetical protein